MQILDRLVCFQHIVLHPPLSPSSRSLLHPPPSIHPIFHIPRWCRRLRGPLATEFLPPAGHACPEWHIFGPTPRNQPSADSSLSSTVTVSVCVRGGLATQHESHRKWLKGSMGQIGDGTEWARILKRSAKIFSSIEIIHRRDDSRVSSGHLLHSYPPQKYPPLSLL